MLKCNNVLKNFCKIIFTYSCIKKLLQDNFHIIISTVGALEMAPPRDNHPIPPAIHPTYRFECSKAFYSEVWHQFVISSSSPHHQLVISLYLDGVPDPSGHLHKCSQHLDFVARGYFQTRKKCELGKHCTSRIDTHYMDWVCPIIHLGDPPPPLPPQNLTKLLRARITGQYGATFAHKISPWSMVMYGIGIIFG